MEDLWAFNDEALVRAVAACNTPIISAVGHETDTTLCDYVADMRAPTPSAAAEMAVPDRITLLRQTDEMSEQLDRLIDRLFGNLKIRVDGASRQIEALSPTAKLENLKGRISAARELIETRVAATLEQKRLMLSSSVARLEDVNPLAVLRRGYSMTLSENNTVVTRTSDVKKDERLSIIVSDGCITAVAERVINTNTEVNYDGK